MRREIAVPAAVMPIAEARADSRQIEDAAAISR
jgi:hypothetical protein